MNRIKDFFKGIYRVFCREFKLVVKDPGIILFIAFLPFAYPIIYSLIYNPELVKDVPMVVVDHDRSSVSRELVRNLNACDQVWIKGYATDLNEARHAMDSHECFAILEIPEGFGRNTGRVQTANAVMYADMSLLLRYRGFLVATTNVMQEMGADITTRDINTVVPMAETLVDGDLLPIHNISMGNIRNGFDSFIMPGVIILILHQCIVLALGMAGGARRERRGIIGYNSHNNARFVPSTMIGTMLCYLTLLILPAIFMIHYVPLIFKFPMAGKLWEELAFILPMMIACCGVGFVFQAFVTERESVFVSWVVTSLFFLLLSGLIWPRYDMPGFWKFISGCCPSTWGVEGFVKMNANGASLWQVRHEYLMLWILAGCWLLLGYVAQRWFVLPSIFGKKNPVEAEAKKILSKADQQEFAK